MNQNDYTQIQKLPNAVAVLVLGISSLVFSCFFVGLVLGIIGVALSKKGKMMYLACPNTYDNYGMLNAGRIMSIIGIVLGAISIVYAIIATAVLGGSALFFLDLLDM